MLLREIENRDKSIKYMYSDKKYKVKLLSHMPEGIHELSDEFVNSLKWVNGEITSPYSSFMFKCDDGHIHPISDIVDFEQIIPSKKKRSKPEEPEYSKMIAWIYQDDYGNDVYIYEGDKVKMKTQEGGYVVGSVMHHEELKKYYILNVLSGMRYFFLFGCEVQKEFV